MILRFLLHTARWFLLQASVATGTGRVLMGAADRGVHAHRPTDQPGSIGAGLQQGKDPHPDTTKRPDPAGPLILAVAKSPLTKCAQLWSRDTMSLD